MTNNKRLERLYARLSARERAAMIYLSYVEDEMPVEEIVSTMPRSQSKDFRRFLITIDAIYEIIRVQISFQYQRSEAIMLRFLVRETIELAISNRTAQPEPPNAGNSTEDGNEEDCITKRTVSELPIAWIDYICLETVHKDLLIELGVEDAPLNEVVLLSGEIRRNLELTHQLMVSKNIAVPSLEQEPPKGPLASWKDRIEQHRQRLS
jgi:hypothetical protein